MKKALIALLLIGFAASSGAGMNDWVISADDLTMATNSVTKTQFLRGEIAAVNVYAPAGGTCDVSVTGGKVGTIFSLAKCTSGTYFPKVQVHNTSGTALTYVGAGDASSTNILYGAIPVGGVVTSRVANNIVVTTAVDYVITILWKE
jgi:hypothetical protein